MAFGKEGGSRRSCTAEGGRKHWPKLITKPSVPSKAPSGSLPISGSISLSHI